MRSRMVKPVSRHAAMTFTYAKTVAGTAGLQPDDNVPKDSRGHTPTTLCPRHDDAQQTGCYS
jgi:hypothetical protein